MPHPRIARDPAIMVGKPVIEGTRVTVETILRRLAAGDGIEQILADYPQLSEADVHAAQTFAAQ